MTAYDQLRARLSANPRIWLVTGVAGFIGCNLLETLLKLDQTVVGLDNFATGHRYNLEQIQEAVSPVHWARFKFIKGDIRQLDDCRTACAGVDDVLHHAALGSVPRSLEDPIATNAANIDGFLSMPAQCGSPLASDRTPEIRRIATKPTARQRAHTDWATQLRPDYKKWAT